MTKSIVFSTGTLNGSKEIDKVLGDLTESLKIMTTPLGIAYMTMENSLSDIYIKIIHNLKKDLLSFITGKLSKCFFLKPITEKQRFSLIYNVLIVPNEVSVRGESTAGFL